MTGHSLSAPRGLERGLSFVLASLACVTAAALLLTWRTHIMPAQTPTGPQGFEVVRPAPPAPPTESVRNDSPPNQHVHSETTIPIEVVDPAAPPSADAGLGHFVGPPLITNPHWIERPNGRDFAREYPTRALERDREGRVELHCVVNAEGRIGCVVAQESPMGWGFGDAALRISRSFRIAPRLENGHPTEGGRINVPIKFRLGS